MPRTRPALAELRGQLRDLLDRGRIQHSTAGHAASMVFARKPGGSWRICSDFRGLNVIMEPLAEPRPHMDALLDETRGACWLTKLDLAQAYHWVRLQDDCWKTGVRSQLGRFEWKVMPFGLQGGVLMRVTNSVVEHRHDAEPSPGGSGAGPDGPVPGPPTFGVLGASGPLHQCVVVYMNLPCYNPLLGQHLRDVREVLTILRKEKLYLKASKCAFCEELGFLGRRVSAAGVAVDPRKVAAFVTGRPGPTTSSCPASWGCATTTPASSAVYAAIAAPLTRLRVS